jgi:hypothetical protein
MDSRRWEDLHKRRAFCDDEAGYGQVVFGKFPNFASSRYMEEGIGGRRSRQMKNMIRDTTPRCQGAARTRNRGGLFP